MNTSRISAEQGSGPESLAGLGGSALVDARGQLVGVVSSGGTDEKTGKVNIWASDRMPIKSFLDSLHADWLKFCQFFQFNLNLINGQ